MCRGNLHSVTVNVKYLAVAQATPLTCLIDLIECGRDRVYHIRIKHGNVGQGAGGWGCQWQVAGCGLRLANVGADEDEGDVVIRSLAKNELIKCVYVMKLYVKCVDNE